MNQTYQSEILLNTKDFSSIKLPTQAVIYTQRCFRSTLIMFCSFSSILFSHLFSSLPSTGYWETFPWGLSSQGMKLTIHLYPVPRSRMAYIYCHSLIRLHSVRLHKLNMETNLWLPFIFEDINTIPSLHRYSISAPQPRCQQWQEELLERPEH